MKVKTVQQQQLQEYRPCIVQESEGFDSSLSIDQCETIREMDDSVLVGAPAAVAAGGMDVSMAVSEASMPVKRKRGRPPRNQGKTTAVVVKAPPPSQRKKKDEEDVCFICFDGGSLVLCDRRGCPKAYHPACIKRDESFFRSKAKWNCGWHICINCQKSSYYMCYTCTFSLCKGCTKDADYVCIRGNKGLCGTCMRTIMLIENIALGNKETVQVDFDDKTSWEYLFKVYWLYLKAKLSLTLDELTKAKNPWKGDELPKAKNSWKGYEIITPKVASSVEICTPKVESSVEICNGNDVKGPCLDNCSENQDHNHSKRRKTMNQPTLLIEENSIQNSIMDKVVTPLPEGMAWATKELLEFVAHMKNGDKSVLTLSDVQALLLEYIKRNNLRDPHQKSQIVCDSRLLNLFGKDRVCHFEMLKLLEHHFLVKEKLPSDNAVGAGVTAAVSIQVAATGNNDSKLTVGNDRRRKTRKRADDIGPSINPNPDEYAAIDVHNINLLYLKRCLMENLMDDAEKFNEKVVGSFVRIRISGGDQKQDMYRLVLVVGTSKVTESYKVGTRTTDVMLEILNLDRKELVPIDEISNQDFSEDECRRLRQSIKFGLIKRLTVGEIQGKAMAFRAVKLSDWLEAEILKLNHLRDRANEKGRRKELRECVEKLELLKSPVERQRKLLEVPTVHADPKMDPSYESEKDDGELDEKKQGERVGRKNSGVRRKRPEISSLLRGGDVLSNAGNRAQRNSATDCEQSENISTTFYVDRDGTTQIHERLIEGKGEVSGINSQNVSKNLVGPTSLVSGDWNDCTAPVLKTTGGELSANEIEMDKLWHYQDPTGKVQGPFPMMQLRKWSISGLFPDDLRVWRINEKQENSILLTDALVGQIRKEPSLPHNSSSVLPDIMAASNNTDNKWEHKLSQSTDGSWVDNGKDDDASVQCNDSNELVRRNGLAPNSSCMSKTVDVTVTSDGQAQGSIQGWELSEGKPGPDQPHACSSFPSSSPSGKLGEDSLFQVREGHGDKKWSSHVSNINVDSQKATEGQISVTECDEKQADSEVHSSQSSGQNWRPLPIDSSSSGWDSKGGISAAKQNQDIDISDLPSPARKQIHGYLQRQAAENKQSISSSVPILDSGRGWSRASSLVGGGVQLPQTAGGWSGYSPSPAKPSIEEWDSNLVSASSLRPTEGASDHAARPTSGNAPGHPAIDVSGWHSMVTEPTEFCPLADESVSDLLAEVEALESLGGLPSPTSKMSCGGDLAQGSDNDCFSPVEGFSPVPDQGKSDALSSTGDIQTSSQLAVTEECLQVSHFPSKLTGRGTQLMASQLPLQLTVTEEPLKLSHMVSQSKIIEELFGASQKPSLSTLTDEPLRLSQTEVLDSLKSLSEHSSPSVEVEGDAKRSDVSVNQWEAGSEKQQPASTKNQGEAGSDIKPPTPSVVRQWEEDSDVQHPAPSVQEVSWGTVKENPNLSRVEASQGSKNTIWGTGHGTVQQNSSSNSGTSTGNSSSWGNQPRYGGDRLSGSRDHRSNFSQGRDSGYGRDRSMWNSRQPSYGVGNGGTYSHGHGHSHRPPPKGPRVCKFYESGYCKKGATCSYLHPS